MLGIREQLETYINSHLKRLSGSFKIYRNKDNRYLHISEKSNIKVDLNFWEFVKLVNKPTVLKSK